MAIKRGREKLGEGKKDEKLCVGEVSNQTSTKSMKMIRCGQRSFQFSSCFVDHRAWHERQTTTAKRKWRDFSFFFFPLVKTRRIVDSNRAIITKEAIAFGRELISRFVSISLYCLLEPYEALLLQILIFLSRFRIIQILLEIFIFA